MVVLKKGAVKPRDATGGNLKEKNLHSLWSFEWIPNTPYLSPADSPTLKISFDISSWYQFIFVYIISKI